MSIFKASSIDVGGLRLVAASCRAIDDLSLFHLQSRLASSKALRLCTLICVAEQHGSCRYIVQWVAWMQLDGK
jgi:hypothetical protein